ncbi:MAG: V-type ATP synthase subunit K [Treponema sp.]|nr:V-type ATP synthase subunit K [Treponema sp.]
MGVGLLGLFGPIVCFGLSTLGAIIAMIINGPAVIGSWKKCYLQKKPAPFILVIFASTCLSNPIYGFITMTALAESVILNDIQVFSMGLIAGSAICISAFIQSICSASAAEAYAETGQGFGNFLMVIGVAETLGLFAMVFTLLFAG